MLLLLLLLYSWIQEDARLNNRDSVASSFSKVDVGAFDKERFSSIVSLRSRKRSLQL